MNLNDLKYSDEVIRDVLLKTKNIALILASHNENKPSNRVMKYLLENGYKVFPVNSRNPHAKIYGLSVFSSLDKIPKKIDMVNIFQRNHDAGQTIFDSIDLDIKYIWTQLEIFNFEAAKEAQKNGHTVIMNRCTKIEHTRLIKK